MSAPVIPSRIERVVVYDNGALVRRRAIVEAGQRRVAIDGLPLRLIDDSLRVRGDGAVQVGLVEERCIVDVVAGGARVDAVALVRVRAAIAAAEQRRKTLAAMRQLAAVDVELPPGDVECGLTLAPLLELLANADRRGAAIDQEEARIAAELLQLHREERAIAAAGAVDVRPPRVLRGVEVEVQGAGALEIDYVVAAARWVPTYGLHVRRVDGQARARLILGALVAQASGEDWHDVEIAVSTTSLARASTLPEVRSWRLGRKQPPRPTGYRPLPSDLPTLFGGWDKFPHPPEATKRRAPPPPLPEPPPAPEQRPVLAAPPRPTMSMPVPAAAPMPPRNAGAPIAMSRRGRAARDEDSVAYRAEPEASFDEGTLSGLEEGGGGGAFGGAPGAGSAARPSGAEELPPRLRTTGLRMAFADEGPTRGKLLPLDLRERLAWLLDVADVSVTDGEARRAEVYRAFDALVEAERRLWRRPLPAGTSRVGGSPARVFTAGSRATISSDGHEHRVEVHREESAAELVHEAVPRESKDVWRLCRVRPTSALPSGPVQVFEDDAFVVAGNVSGSAGAVLRFNLGVDPDVKIESRAPHVHQAEKGLMGGTTHVEHKVTTVVRSTRKEPVELTIYDRLPVPGADVKDVTVTLGECAPPLSVTDRSPDGGVVKGGFKVSVRLMPGEKRTLEHAYTITLPAKLEVVGGNRRE